MPAWRTTLRVSLPSIGFAERGGHSHYSKEFSIALIGGLKIGQAVGVTDELGCKIIDTPFSVSDVRATIHCALGIDPENRLFDEDCLVPITDRGQPPRQSLFLTNA